MRWIGFFSVLFFAIPGHAIEYFTDEMIALVGVNVIPMNTETVLSNQTILVKDGKINKIGDVNSVKIPRKAERVDMKDAYVIPGLIDLHIHFNAGRKNNAEQLNFYIANGVTSALCMRGSKGLRNLVEQVDSGEILGPEVFCASPIQGNISPTPPTYEIGQNVVRQFHKEGYDFVKVYNFIPEEGYRGIVDEAKKLNMRLVGHTVRSVGLDECLASGQHLAHMEEVIYGFFADGLDESKIPEVTKKFKDAGTSIIATLIAYHNIIRQVDDIETMLQTPGIEYLPKVMTNSWHPPINDYLNRFDAESNRDRLKPAFAFQQKLLKSFVEADVPILLGTDAGIPIVVPGYSAHAELLELVESGMTPYQALEAGTRGAAEFLEAADEIGTIEVGKRADFIVLEKNPLNDIRNSTSILGVSIRGKWMEKPELQKLMDDIKPD